MKKSFYLLILLAILLQSCSFLDPYGKGYINYGATIGSTEKNDNISYIQTDDTVAILIKNMNFPDSVLGQRIYLEGDFYKGSGGYTYAINVLKNVLVPIKEIQDAENQNVIDLANNASMSLNNNGIWQTIKYLNISLSYYASEPNKHSFSFFINNQTEMFDNNRVTIYICHDNGGDKILYQSYSMLLSLDLTKLFDKFTDKFDIKFVYTENSNPKDLTIVGIKNYRQ